MASKGPWSPAARKKRKATFKATLAAKKAAAAGVKTIPFSAIPGKRPKKMKYIKAKYTPKGNIDRVRLAADFVKLIRDLLEKD